MKFNLLILIGTFTCGKSEYTPFIRPRDYIQPRRTLQPIKLETSTPMDLFFAEESARRNQILTSIWKWDWWCQLQPKSGQGEEILTRYYYDSQLDQCFTFSYGGSDGNENNFQSLVECERHCKGTVFMTLKNTARTSYCGLQPNAGMCLALNYRYYYDLNMKKCKRFVYGGCGGNQNRFQTEQECIQRCSTVD